MRNYDYNKLLDERTFEYFAKDFIEVLENKRFEIFSEGKDGGIDLRNVTDDFLTVVQVKRYKDFNSLYNQLKKTELEKVNKIKPNRYIIITSSNISVGNKQKIKELFNDYIINEQDIIGCEELNGLLEKPKFKRVEDEYYQLWINSTNTLKDFIKKGLNADTYNYTSNEIESIKEDTNIYVKSESFNKALRIIKNKKCLLICGEPGVGKTILAHNICAYLMNQNKNIEFISDNKISKIAKLLSDDKPQLFFIDDFWGSKFDNNLQGDEENNLKKIIQIINRSENKILILTSREYILSQGYAQYPELEEFFDKYKLNLYIEDYSDLYKARILFKHLVKSELDLFDIHVIANEYKKIIYNDNYRPRIIENYLKFVSDREIEPDNYLEVFIDYLNNPEKLWEEVFAKQHEGAQLIAILMLMFGDNTKLSDVRNLFNRYIEYDSKTNARKKDFLKYITQLENTLITTYEAAVGLKNEVFVKFKNSSIELYVYKYFMENLEEYAYTIINCTPYINTLMYLVGSWSIIERYSKKAMEYEKLEVDRYISQKLKQIAVERIKNDFEQLQFVQEDVFRTYSESDELYVHKIILCIMIYKKYRDEGLKIFIKNKIEKTLEKLENDKYFDYDDLFSIPRCIKEAMDENICEELDISKIMEDTFKAIRFSRQFLVFEFFVEYFQQEYNKFFKENMSKIISKIYNLIIEDADFFLEDGEYDFLDELIEETIPSLFDFFELIYSKEYMDEFYDVTGRRLLVDDREENEYDDLEIEYEDDDMEEMYEREKEEKMIEQEKENMLKSLYEDNIVQDDVKEFFEKNIEDKTKIDELVTLFNDYDKNYIRQFMEEWDNLELLVEYINEMKKVADNSKEFFELFIKFIEKKGIDNGVIEKLKILAYKTFKEGRCYIFKREILEHIDEDELEVLMENNILYTVRKKYYFATMCLHIYFALNKMIEEKESFSVIYNNAEYTSFRDTINDLSYIYSDIDLEKFNLEFLKPEIDSLIDEIENEDIKMVRKSFFEKLQLSLDINTDINLEERWIINGGSTSGGANLEALEYLGFDMYYMACNTFDIEQINKIALEIYGDTDIILDLAKDVEDKRRLKFIEKLGIVRYVDCFYEYLCSCSKQIEENSRVDLKKKFESMAI